MEEIKKLYEEVYSLPLPILASEIDFDIEIYDPVLVAADIVGCVQTFLSNRGKLDPQRIGTLKTRVSAINSGIDEVPEKAKEFFLKHKELGELVLKELKVDIKTEPLEINELIEKYYKDQAILSGSEMLFKHEDALNIIVECEISSAIIIGLNFWQIRGEHIVEINSTVWGDISEGGEASERTTQAALMLIGRQLPDEADYVSFVLRDSKEGESLFMDLVNPKKQLYYAIKVFLRGKYSVKDFCSNFERIYNLELDKSTLTKDEKKALGNLFDKVVYFSPVESEYEGHLDGDDIYLAVKEAASILNIV